MPLIIRFLFWLEYVMFYMGEIILNVSNNGHWIMGSPHAAVGD